MSRDRPEWIASNDSQAIPRLVKARIWLREDGRCYLTGEKIKPGDTYEFEHVIALECGGEHRESNIRLAKTAPHAAKTAQDHDTGAKIKRVHAKHNGYWTQPTRKIAAHVDPWGKQRRKASHNADLSLADAERSDVGATPSPSGTPQ